MTIYTHTSIYSRLKLLMVPNTDTIYTHTSIYSRLIVLMVPNTDNFHESFWNVYVYLVCSHLCHHKKLGHKALQLTTASCISFIFSNTHAVFPPKTRVCFTSTWADRETGYMLESSPSFLTFCWSQ